MGTPVEPIEGLYPVEAAAADKHAATLLVTLLQRAVDYSVAARVLTDQLIELEECAVPTAAETTERMQILRRVRAGQSEDLQPRSGLEQALAIALDELWESDEDRLASTTAALYRHADAS